MTGGPDNLVSLARARKDRARSAQKAEADANALRFGRTRAERAADEARADRAARSLDAHRRDPADAPQARPEIGPTSGPSVDPPGTPPTGRRPT